MESDVHNESEADTEIIVVPESLPLGSLPLRRSSREKRKPDRWSAQ